MNKWTTLLILTACLLGIRHYLGFEIAELVAFAVIIAVELEKNEH